MYKVIDADGIEHRYPNITRVRNFDKIFAGQVLHLFLTEDGIGFVKSM